MKRYATLGLILLHYLVLPAQHHHPTDFSELPLVEQVEAQPLLAQALRVGEALSFMGSALPPEAIDQLRALQQESLDQATVRKVQQILDPYCLAMIDINAESRVKVFRGPATAQLLQDGWSTFLLKVHNQAHVRAQLVPESPNAQPVLHGSTGAPRMKEEHALTPGQLDNRFLEMAIYRDRPLQPALSGLGLEYAVIQLYTRQQGQREAQLGFNVGQGTQDIGFRNTIDILFDIQPAVKVYLEVEDEDQSPVMASFIISDGIDRLSTGDATAALPGDYRLTRARSRHWEEPRPTASPTVSPEQTLRGIYPLPSRRVAGEDAFPDFFFQPQVYRTSGEYVTLPPGQYRVEYGRGPEYYRQEKQITVPDGIDSMQLSFPLKRWIHMAELGWYSADHHIHAAGCSHYESPQEGVLPEHMWRQVLGEDLNLGSNLTWGPSWYYQKQFFTGGVHPLSDQNNLLRYDVEVSGFPSSHAGHVVLLNLKEDDYPNTTRIEEWPTFTLPVLQWAKDQGGVTGYAHSGWGLAPVEPTPDLPNYIMPKMDGIGANEYVVTVTHDVVDFYSAGDTPAPAELNMWYHTLNCGFRVRLSGETDFPCISDERVGRARIYAKLEKELSFTHYMEALKAGRSYVSDGYAHLIDFTVNGLELGTQNSELVVAGTTGLNIQIKAAAYLEETQGEIGAIIAQRNLYQSPYWHIERSRMGTSRQVPVELIVNGRVVETKEINANGEWQDLQFEYTVDQSSWVAVRIFPTAHTNPIFVTVDNQPILEKKSAEWCRAAVDQCWKMKSTRFRDTEMEAAQAAYDHARSVYDTMIRGR
jgi:hypothetical protein